MITLIKQPPTLNYSKNPVPLRMSSNDIVLSPEIKFKIDLYLNGATCTSNALGGTLVEGDVLILTWLNKTVIINVKNAPDTLGFEIPSGSGNIAHANSICTYLNYNRALAADFTFTAENTGSDIIVHIHARKYGYNPLTNNTFSNAIDQTTNEVEAVHRQNFKFWWSLNKKDGASYSQVLSRLEDYSNDYETKLDISSVLKAELQFDRPTLLETNTIVCVNSKKTFFLTYAEYYGLPASTQELKWTNDFHAYLGGISRTHYPNNSFFTTYLNDGDRFLTWIENNRLVRVDQPHFLSYILQKNSVSNVKIKKVVTYTDNTTSAASYSPAIAVSKYDKLLVPAGYKQLSIGAVNPAKTVKSYTITLVNAVDNSAISEVRNFIIDRSEFEYIRYFLYHSSLGNYETFSTNGKAEKDLNFSIESAEINLEYDYKNNEAEFVEFNASISEVFTINSGYIFSKNEVDRFIDFVTSEDKLFYDNARNLLLPIAINTKSIKAYKDGQGLFSVKFEYVYRFNESVYSDPGINLDPDNGSVGVIGSGGLEV